MMLSPQSWRIYSCLPQKIHSCNTRSSISNNFCIKKSKLEIERKSFSKIGAKLWNEIQLSSEHYQNSSLKEKFVWSCSIYDSEDSCEDLKSIIWKVLSSYQLSFAYLIVFVLLYLSTSHNILRCQPQLVT